MSDDVFDPDRYGSHLYRTADRRRRYEGQRGPAFSAWQAAFREDLRSALGLPVVAENAPDDPDLRRVAADRADGYERQEWRLRTETDVRVPFYLLLPAEPDPPYPVVLTLHGHNETGKELPAGEPRGQPRPEAVAEERRDAARQAVDRGYAAVAPDMRAFGALAGAEGDDGACTTLQKHAQLYGRSLAGERVWDVLRLVDAVERLPDLDAERVGVTGHSGGGTVTLLAAALDERLSPVVPNCYVCSFRESLLAVDHCECNYVPGLLRLGEVWDLAGLVAPRPLGVVAGERDPIFPIAGVRRAVERIRDVYAAVDADDRCGLYVGDGGHEFYPEGVWPFVADRL